MALRLSIAIGISLAAASAAADPALDRLEAALPAGWSLLATGSDLVIRHDRPCYAAAGGPVITLELRYRLEPRWTAPQLAAARAANDEIAGELRALAARYRIDAIRTAGGRPQPATADERSRLAAYEAGRARLEARRVALPRCTLGEASVFDGDDTYAQLRLRVDPPEAMAQAHRVVELVKQHCR